MRYKPQPKGEIDSQIFSFCLTDKILGRAARFDGSVQNGNTDTLQEWQRSLSFFLYLAKVVMTLGSRNALLCTYPCGMIQRNGSVLFPAPYQFTLRDAFCPNDCEVAIPPNEGNNGRI